MKLYKNKYRTDSIRLKGWDYRKSGRYFVTICTKNRHPFFGLIHDDIMGLTHTGLVAHWFWTKIPDQFPHVQLDEFIVMPNHMHGILGIMNDGCEDHRSRDEINRVSTNGNADTDDITQQPGGATGKHNPMISGGNLGQIIRWYKGRCTYEIHKRNYHNFQWQGRFWDHIIRNEQSLERIRQYIYNNPLNWDTDQFYEIN